LILCLDAAYREDLAVACAVAFSAPDSLTFEALYYGVKGNVPRYQAGSLYLRELPVLLEAIEQFPGTPNLVMVDGYAWLPGKRPGLGMHLFRALDEKVPVIGVAKNPYRGHAACKKVFRGRSRRPLFVTACGIRASRAAEMVSQMSGKYRLPDMIRLADRRARSLIAGIQEEREHG